MVPKEMDLDYGIKTNCIYAATIDAGQIYTEQTGRFPVVSSKGNKYVMVLYEYDGNAILAEPIKNRTSQELLVNPSGKASTQIPQLPLGDNSSPWGDNAVCT
jgi:hypothetical protein